MLNQCVQYCDFWAWNGNWMYLYINGERCVQGNRLKCKKWKIIWYEKNHLHDRPIGFLQNFLLAFNTINKQLCFLM